jgi:hypothetical protein
LTYRRAPLKNIRFFNASSFSLQKMRFFQRIVVPLSKKSVFYRYRRAPVAIQKLLFPFTVLTAPLDGFTTISKDHFLSRVDEILFQISHRQRCHQLEKHHNFDNEFRTSD